MNMIKRLLTAGLLAAAMAVPMIPAAHAAPLSMGQSNGSNVNGWAPSTQKSVKKDTLISSGYDCKYIATGFYECKKTGSTTYWCDGHGSCQPKPRTIPFDPRNHRAPSTGTKTQGR